MEELYKSLIINLNTLRLYDLSDQDKECGSPPGLSTVISALYLLVKYNPELLQIKVNDRVLYYHLFNLAKIELEHLYHDYCWDNYKDESEYSINDFISSGWMSRIEDYDEYYYSNDAYNLNGVMMVQFQRLVLLSKPN